MQKLTFLVLLSSLILHRAHAGTTNVILGPGSNFNPSSITVNVGDTVHWDNSTGSGGFHNVAPNGGTEPAANGAGTGWTYDFTFNNPGAFAYFCQVHGLGMSGVVNVAPATTPTETPTASPSPTITATPTDVPPGSTATDTPTISETPTISPVSSATPSVTPTRTPGSPVIQFFGPGQDALLAPNPAKIGDPVCLFMDGAPAESTWSVYNSAVEKVATLRFGAGGRQCLDTANLAPGLYYIEVNATMPDASVRKLKRKAVLWR
jgi:plastocyanin